MELLENKTPQVDFNNIRAFIITGKSTDNA